MNLLQMSLSASVLILIVIACRKFFSARIPRTTFSLLWLLAWLKLMIPVPAGFPVPAAHQLGEKMPDITVAYPFRREPGRQPRPGRTSDGISLKSCGFAALYLSACISLIFMPPV